MLAQIYNTTSRFRFLALLLVLSVAGMTQGQIKVIKKPALKVGPTQEVVYDRWVSSWGLREDPKNKYPLGIKTHKTQAQAVASAKAHMASTAKNGNYAVTHYLIVGEPSIKQKSGKTVQQGKTLLARLRQAKSAVDHAKKVAKGDASIIKAKERQLGSVIKEYGEQVGRIYRQIRAVKKTMTGGVASLTDAKLRQVNGLIDQYNRDINSYQSVMGSTSRLGYSSMSSIPPPTALKAKEQELKRIEATLKEYYDWFDEEKKELNRRKNGLESWKKLSRDGGLTWNKRNPACRTGLSYARCHCRDGARHKAKVRGIINQIYQKTSNARSRYNSLVNAWNTNLARFNQLKSRHNRVKVDYQQNLADYSKQFYGQRN